MPTLLVGKMRLSMEQQQQPLITAKFETTVLMNQQLAKLKGQHLDKVKEITQNLPFISDAPIEVTVLATKEKRRPLLLEKIR